MADSIIQQFKSGTYNVIDSENIPKDASSDSQNWITIDGHIELIRGREKVGTEGAVGKVLNQHFGFRADGTRVHYRKIGTKIQYFNGTAWTDVITGLTESAKYAFNNYQSLAGTFVFATGADGLYKIHTANPTSYIDMYDSTKNFKAKSFIDKARMLMWDLPNDKTGLYGSKIDPQTSAVYTTVSNENLATGNGVTTTFSGTLAFKGSNPKANCFGVVVKCTDVGGETFSDNYNGVLTGSAGGTGTINYMTGAWSVTFVTVPASSANNIKADYQWENSNSGGLTDFTKSATRVAGEGFIVRQDEGGDPILRVLIGPDGAYYSLKSTSSYRFEMDSTDVNPTNKVFRKDIGIKSFGGGVSTGLGIVFMNTANPDKPELTILEQNPLGDNLQKKVLLPQYAFQNFYYDSETEIDTFNRFIVIACKSSSSVGANDRLILANIGEKMCEATTYPVSSFSKDNTNLYAGSSLSYTTYKMFVDFDDDGSVIDNYWMGKSDTFDMENLKKYRKLRLKGLIDPSQSYEVYIETDGGGDFQWVGTVLGSGSYVDFSTPQTIGSNLVGSARIGGETTTVYPYFMEIKVKLGKFRSRRLKFMALGYGYVSIDQVIDSDFLIFEERLPKRYRLKQNVSLDGTQTDLPTPEY